MAPHCLLVEASGEEGPNFELLEDVDTVLSARIFQKKINLEFNSSCVEDDEDEEDFEILY